MKIVVKQIKIVKLASVANKNINCLVMRIFSCFLLYFCIKFKLTNTSKFLLTSFFSFQKLII